MGSDFFDDRAGELVSRRDVARKMGFGAVMFAAPAPSGGAAAGRAPGGGGRAAGGALTDQDIMNFALNLEYLEAEFYLRAARNTSLVELGVISEADTTGPTTGGKLVPNLGSDSAEFIARAVGTDELNHVKFFRSALGSAAVKKPAIDLDALGFGFGSVADFLRLARIFEDTGVSAFSGAIGLLSDEAHRQAAAKILATEAEHAGAIRLLAISHGVEGPAFDDLDIPPTKEHPFSTDPDRGMTVTRDARQILRIIYGGKPGRGGFYPQGLNGTVR